MYYYFSASHSQMTAQSLSPISILLLFLCELCTSETLSVFVVCYWCMLINFYIACATIFQPVSARWQLSPRYFTCYVSDALLRLSFSCYWHMLTNFYIACTTNFQPPSARWQLSPRYQLFTCYVSDAWLRLSFSCYMWFKFKVHILLFFSQSQPADSLESLPALNSSSHTVWVMPVWDSLCLFFFIQ